MRRAIEFRETLRRAKAQFPEIAWYPYDSLSNVQHLETLLDGGSRAALDHLVGGKPCLDVGCGDGDLSFFLEHLGYAVHAIDNPTTNFNGLQGVEALRQALGSSLCLRALNIDEQCRLPQLRFGLGLALGVIYHLKNPFVLLDQLARCCDWVILSSRIMATAPGLPGRIDTVPVAFLLEEDQLNADNSNFWIFTDACLRRMIARSKFEVVRSFRVSLTPESDPVSLEGDERAFYLLRSVWAMNHLRLLQGWHQAEGEGWRWVEAEFSLGLDPLAIGFVYRISLKLFALEQMIDASDPLRIEAFSSGQLLSRYQLHVSGEHSWVLEVPHPANSDSVQVDFRVNRALPPDEQDRRERALIVGDCRVETVAISDSQGK